MRTNSVAFRLLMGTALWTTGALVVSGFVLAALFNEHVERSFDRRADILLESVIAAVELDRSGRPVLTRIPGEPRFTQPFSGLYWQVSKGGEIVLRSRSLWDEELREPDNDGESQLGRYELSGPQSQRLRVSGRGITLPGSSDAFRFAIASDVAEIDEALRPFNLTLGWSLGVLWLGLFGAVIIQVRFGLRPLRRIQAKLADVRRGRAERLPVDFPIEVMPLVEELNAHLHQITQVIERARTHVGNLAHALKTPLTVLSNEATRAEGPLAETVQRQAEVMRRRVDHHLVRARTAATASVLGARTPLLPVVEDLRRTLLRIHAERSLQIEVHGGERLTFRGDRQDLEEIIGNVLDNGCKWATSTVRLKISSSDDEIQVTIEDDGPGLPTGLRATALNRGQRLDESVPGSGLGLAIVQEIAGLYGGGIELAASELGGLRVDLRLPATDRSDAA